jgi:hypothetical protein
MIMWLAFALGFGAFVTSLFVFVWKAFRRRTRGWILDSILLGACGFVLVLTMMSYVIWADGHLPKEIQSVVGPFVLVAIALALVRASNGLREIAIRKKKLGSEK